jgi:hypothetical protein
MQFRTLCLCGRPGYLELKMTYSKEELKAAHKHCGRNRDAIRQSVRCGCFYCLAIYPAGAVEEYTYSDATLTNKGDALCPKCGIDSVIPDASGYALNDAFLSAMYDYWFDTEVS